MAAKRKRRRKVNLGAVTQKDFVAMSKILCRNGASDRLIGSLADYFGEQNPHFDRTRFIRATQKC